MEMRVVWKKCAHGSWCELYKLNIAHDYFNNLEGVYILWYKNEDGGKTILSVGGGLIATELKKLKEDTAVLAFESYELSVTWTAIDSKKHNSIIKFLIKSLNPMLTKNAPGGFSKKVNLPW
jgi:hypothetical protein